MYLSQVGVRIVGTSADMIDMAEDRQKFSSMLDEIGVDQPAWKQLLNLEQVLIFAESVEYPVLVRYCECEGQRVVCTIGCQGKTDLICSLCCSCRPSYVLSGAAMNVANTEKQLTAYLGQAAAFASDHPPVVVVSKFITGAKVCGRALCSTFSFA